MIKYLTLCFILLSSLTYASVEDRPIPVVDRGVFEDLKRRVGGTTFSSSLFREIRTGQSWIGKSPLRMYEGTFRVNRELTESDVCREKIASDVYEYFGIMVPETVLSQQSAVNTGMPELEGHVVMHIMSRFIEGYHDYKDQVGFVGFSESLDPRRGPILSHGEGCPKCAMPSGAYMVEGLGRIAAVATWLHDIDFMGGSATNVGYKLINRGDQRIAKAVIVDPGYSFENSSDNAYPPRRHIRLATNGSMVSFDALCPPDTLARREFIETLHRILLTEERTIVQFFTRRNAEYFVSRDPRSVPGLTKQLMERKADLAGHYAQELRMIAVPMIVPSIAIGFEEAYRQFLSLRLIYKPNNDNEEGKTETLITSLPNPLEGLFTLPEGFDKHFSLQTGFKRKGKDTLEIFIIPRFLVENDPTWMRGIMREWVAPYGLFWILGEEGSFSYLVDHSVLDTKSLFEKWQTAKEFSLGGVARLMPTLPRLTLYKLTQLFLS